MGTPLKQTKDHILKDGAIQCLHDYYHQKLAKEKRKRKKQLKRWRANAKRRWKEKMALKRKKLGVEKNG